MAIISADPRVYRFRVRARALGQLILNHFDWKEVPMPAGNLTVDEMSALLLGLKGRWETELMDLLPTEYEPQLYELQEIKGALTPPNTDNPKWATFFGETNVAIPTIGDGTMAGTVLPTMVAASCRRIPFTALKYWRSNTRISPLVEANVFDNEIADAWRQTLEDALNAFAVPITINVTAEKDFEHVIFSPGSMVDRPTLGDSPWPHSGFVQTYQVHATVSTQRTRRPSLGGD